MSFMTQPRLRKKSLSIAAFEELRSISFATQKADKKWEKKGSNPRKNSRVETRG
jgi:hypothetical protein